MGVKHKDADEDGEDHQRRVILAEEEDIDQAESRSCHHGGNGYKPRDEQHQEENTEGHPNGDGVECDPHPKQGSYSLPAAETGEDRVDVPQYGGDGKADAATGFVPPSK